MKLRKILIVLLVGLLLISTQSKRIHKLSLKRNATPIYLNADKTWAEAELNKLSLEEKIAQFFMVASWPNKDEEHQKEIEHLVKKHHIGGIIFFQGTKAQLKTSVDRFQKVSKTPLLIGIDGEWGTAMRISDMKRFPYAHTLGACNDPEITKNLAKMMAQECREMGIHINFAPVADVNSNPENPVIGFRSFGENPSLVANHVKAYVEGLEENGVMSCIKHFPGHGDSEKDSHLELPTIKRSEAQFNEIEFVPFAAGIGAGTSSVMVGHLNVPSLDDSNTPSSLSTKIIQDYLKKQLNFKGLVISDALNMKGVADHYGKTEVVVKAFEAGNDILLYPEEIEGSIDALVKAVRSGKITENEIDKRCLKVLLAKSHVQSYQHKKKIYTQEEIEWEKQKATEKAITVVKNEGIFPIKDRLQKIAVISVGSNPYHFQGMMKNYQKADYFNFDDFDQAKGNLPKSIELYDLIILSVHTKSILAKDNFSLPKGDFQVLLTILPSATKKALLLFGNPLMYQSMATTTAFQSVIFGFENNVYAQEATGQLIFGAISAQGKLPFQVTKEFPANMGLKTDQLDVLKFSCPEELGIATSDLAEIQTIVQKGLDAKAFPGCQVFVAVKGKVIYRKNFGTVTYEDLTPVNDHHLYDIASVTKIVASTAGLMKLNSEQKFSLDKQLKDYLPDLVGGSDVANIRLKNMMAHQAGFTPWLAFYKSTLNNGQWNLDIYKCDFADDYCVPVADNLWISNTYENKIYQKILSTNLNTPAKYEYSDLGYYFAKKIIEKQGDLPLDQYLYANFYDPMGLYHMRYLPLLYFPKSQIIPTENDTIFRKQLVHGYVHDPGAAMLGGVGGHAGIFSNSTDLGAMMQLYLNKGSYGGKRYIAPEIIEQYTSAQLPGNRRGAGFDRPTASKEGGPTCNLVSSESYGHSGFTGTFTWADPVYGINYVFLSNRVNPDANNKKIQSMNTRTEIQRVIYQAVQKTNKN